MTPKAIAILNMSTDRAGQLRAFLFSDSIDRAFPAPLSGFRLSRPNVQLGGSLAGKLCARVSSIISSESFSSSELLPIALLHFSLW
jgi:hypothetical protein